MVRKLQEAQLISIGMWHSSIISSTNPAYAESLLYGVANVVIVNVLGNALHVVFP